MGRPQALDRVSTNWLLYAVHICLNLFPFTFNFCGWPTNSTNQKKTGRFAGAGSSSVATYKRNFNKCGCFSPGHKQHSYPCMDRDSVLFRQQLPHVRFAISGFNQPCFFNSSQFAFVVLLI